MFTTHTPVPAGHDRFPRDVCDQVLGPALAGELERLGCFERGQLNMTNLGMFFAGFINGVAQRHAAVSQAMFPRYTVRSVTNGVHVRTWAAPSSQRLFDHHTPRWREDNAVLRYLSTAPLSEMRAPTTRRSRSCSTRWRAGAGARSLPWLTIGVARRAAAYKRNNLLLSDLPQLRRLVMDVGPVQVLYSGKSHPQDDAGKEVVARVVAAARELGDTVPVVYLENYDMALGALLCAGVDLWLNTPVAPHEASGTSGMKAAVNGVPSLSVLDGWWVEGHIEGVTGWAIGDDPGARAVAGDLDGADDAADAAEMYRVLREIVVPLYYWDPTGTRPWVAAPWHSTGRSSPPSEWSRSTPGRRTAPWRCSGRHERYDGDGTDVERRSAAAARERRLPLPPVDLPRIEWPGAWEELLNTAHALGARPVHGQTVNLTAHSTILLRHNDRL